MQNTHKSAFPLDNAVTWNNQGHMTIPNSHLESWLLNTGSLTQRLKTHCAEFNVQVVGQYQALATVDEYRQLAVEPEQCRKQDWQIREVILHGDTQPWVLARSVIPQALCERDFLDLGDKPLGHLIFNDNRFKRQPFQLMCMQPSDAFLHHYSLPAIATMWGRRSVFHYQNYAMMVAELFLPQAPVYRGASFEQ